MGDLCEQVEWNFLEAASAYSSFSGLATSMVLASLVIVLVQYKGEEDNSGPVALFTITLLALGTDTFIFGSAIGDSACARASTQGMLASSTLGVGVVILLTGISALQARFKQSLSELALVGAVVTAIGAAGSMGLLTLWSVRYVNGAVQLGLRPGPPMSFVPAMILIGLFVAMIVVVALRAPGERVRRRAIVLATGVYLLHILAVIVMYMVTIVVPMSEWTVRTGLAIELITVAITIGFPLVELAAIVVSIDWRVGRGRWRDLLADRTAVIPAQHREPAADPVPQDS
ncbi:hypothetical protein AB5J62_22400 [Amycolatopsis sp. cg5]|uniref:hypothetical protein n=1 Tax=Amycolatopsis sp. cg5 TaxID=3238802 RepID=UPI0035241198